MWIEAMHEAASTLAHSLVAQHLVWPVVWVKKVSGLLPGVIALMQGQPSVMVWFNPPSYLVKLTRSGLQLVATGIEDDSNLHVFTNVFAMLRALSKTFRGAFQELFRLVQKSERKFRVAMLYRPNLCSLRVRGWCTSVAGQCKLELLVSLVSQ